MHKRRAVLPTFARQDVEDILSWSVHRFGAFAGLRYQTLLLQALRDLEQDPLCIGSKERTDIITTARTYHLSFSRNHVQGEPVKTPRHLILYRLLEDRVDIGRILHDRCDLARYIPTYFLN